MSHRKPTKTDFKDDWRDDAACLAAVTVEPSLQTAWDNIDHGDHYEPDPMADVAKQVCFACKVRMDCLIDAILDSESDGIRGGYRFNEGTVSRDEAKKIFNEFGIRARVRKKASKHDSEEMQEVQPND